MGLAPSPMNHFVDSASRLIDGVPVFGNTSICVDSLCTRCRSSINFYCSPNPVSKLFFGASCLCGMMGAVPLDTALVTSFVGRPITE